MVKNIIKIGAIAVLAITLNACSSKTYKIKQESDKIVNEVPKWYMADFDKKNACDISLLIRQKEDVHGRLKHESLTQRFAIKELKKITRGVLWKISLNSGNIQDVLDQIFNTNILHNPQSHECYRID